MPDEPREINPPVEFLTPGEVNSIRDFSPHPVPSRSASPDPKDSSVQERAISSDGEGNSSAREMPSVPAVPQVSPVKQTLKPAPPPVAKASTPPKE